MARVNIPVNEIVREGLMEPTAIVGDYSLGHVFENNGRIWIEISNSGGANRAVTFPTPGLSDGLAVADLVVTVTDGTSVSHGPFNTQTFNQAGDVVYIDIDSTGLEFAAFKLATS